MTKERQFKLCLLLSAVWMLVIFCFSHQANSGRITEDYLGGANVPVRKFAHMFEFAVLAILYYRSLLLGACLALQKSPDYSANNSASNCATNSASNAATNAADYSGDSSGEKSLEIEGEFSTQISPKIANKETAKNAAASISVRASGRASVSSVNHLKLAILALFMAIAYALCDEWHQSFVPGRSATLSDVMVDASGSLIGLLLIWFGSRGRSAR